MTRIKEHPVLTFNRGRKVTFVFDGKSLEGYENETVSAALLANGINVFRESLHEHRPRGFFCGIGRCSSCNMIIDGVPNMRACATYVREGMVVKTQKGLGGIDGQ